MPRRRQKGSGLPSAAEVNVTSLVDVAFTLLVIFIIAAPVLQGGIDVDVPEADVPPITQADDPVFVDVDRNGRVFLQEREFSLEDFENSFAQLAEVGDFQRVYFRGDSLAPYGIALQVMSVMRNSGVDWSMVAAPAPRPRSGG